MRYQTNRVYKLSQDDFISLIKESVNITDALRKLGYTNPRAKRCRDTLLARIKELNIDTSHFNQINKSINASKYEMEEILIENSSYQNIRSLKARIIRNNIIPHENCAICGIERIWNGLELKLQLDHINGINNDHRIENLRFVCPNCHSQTETYAGKNTKKII